MIEVSCNAWTGAGRVIGTILEPARWALQRSIEAAPRLLAPRRADLSDWRDKRVGWGVVLADGARIPPPIAELVARRKAPVFRYLKGSPYEFICLRNYEAGKDVDINGAPHGTAPEALPFYLLIVGSPEEVPWQLQYILTANRCAGRLHLSEPGLTHYVNALLSDKWSAAEKASNPNHAVIWAVDRGEGDITQLMRNAIAAPLAAQLRDDDQIGAGAEFIDGTQQKALIEDLAKALGTQRPGLIVTTSHGMTGPLEDGRAMLQNLGRPVDSDGQCVSARKLIGPWSPAGAIWYSHACCSAGSDRVSSFTDLFSGESPIGKVLAGVAALGSQVAPLPSELLGAEQPLRAFIGHVEPTFDWTLQQPATGQLLTAALIDALYGYLYVKKGEPERPVGYAFREWYLRSGGLRSQFEKATRQFNTGLDTDGILLALRLAARDIETTVILGDPAVAMPGLV